MYRAAAKRLIDVSRSRLRIGGGIFNLHFKNQNASFYSSFSDSNTPSSSSSDRIPNRCLWNSTDLKSEQQQPPSFLYVESSKSSSPPPPPPPPSTSSSSTSYSAEVKAEEFVRRFESDRGQPGRGGRNFHGLTTYQAEQARVLEASLLHYFMDKCLDKLMDVNDKKEEELRNFSQSERLYRVVKTRLEMQTFYIAKWPQVLTIQALPSNVLASFKQRAMLVDEFWQAAGDTSSDFDWYVNRAILGGIYSTTEIYMLTDVSPDFRDTWRFLDSRVRDAFLLKNTLLEAKYFFEAVGTGMTVQLQRLTA